MNEIIACILVVGVANFLALLIGFIAVFDKLDKIQALTRPTPAEGSGREG